MNGEVIPLKRKSVEGKITSSGLHMLFVGLLDFTGDAKRAEKCKSPRLTRIFLAIVQGLKVTSVYGMGEVI